MTKDARIVLRTNIELTRQNFHQMLNMIPEKALTQPSKNPAWTNGELLMQMCIAPRRILSNMKNVVDHSWIYPPVIKLFPMPLRDKLNERYDRYKASTSTPLSLGIEFDKTCLFTLKLLEEMWDQDFETPLLTTEDALLSGNVTRREMFGYLPYCFNTYSQQLEIRETQFPDPAFQIIPRNPSAGH
jgi:hypothetical protein